MNDSLTTTSSAHVHRISLAQRARSRPSAVRRFVSSVTDDNPTAFALNPETGRHSSTRRRTRLEAGGDDEQTMRQRHPPVDDEDGPPLRCSRGTQSRDTGRWRHCYHLFQTPVGPALHFVAASNLLTRSTVLYEHSATAEVTVRILFGVTCITWKSPLQIAATMVSCLLVVTIFGNPTCTPIV